MGFFSNDFFGNLSTGVKFLAPHLLSIASSIISPVNAEIIDDDVALNFLGCMKQFVEKLEYVNLLLSIRDDELLPLRDASISNLCTLPITEKYKSALRDLNGEKVGSRINVRVFSEAVIESIKIISRKYFLEITANEVIYTFFEIDCRMNLRTEKIRLLIDQIAPSQHLNPRPVDKFIYPPRNSLEQGFLRLKSDALLALARINPNRMLAPSGSLAIQGTKFYSIEAPSDIASEMIDGLEPIYDFFIRKIEKTKVSVASSMSIDESESEKADSEESKMNESSSAALKQDTYLSTFADEKRKRSCDSKTKTTLYHIEAHPKLSFVSEEVFSRVYLRGDDPKDKVILSKLTMYDFWKLDSKLFEGDPNYSICAITDKILGSSRTSLNFMIEFCHVYGIWLATYFKDINYGLYDYEAFFEKRGIPKPEIVSNVEILIALCQEDKLRKREVLELFDILYRQIDILEELLFTYGIGREVLDHQLGTN